MSAKGGRVGSLVRAVRPPSLRPLLSPRPSRDRVSLLVLSLAQTAQRPTLSEAAPDVTASSGSLSSAAAVPADADGNASFAEAAPGELSTDDETGVGGPADACGERAWRRRTEGEWEGINDVLSALAYIASCLAASQQAWGTERDYKHQASSLSLSTRRAMGTGPVEDHASARKSSQVGGGDRERGNGGEGMGVEEERASD